jgi:hypothetical protein
MGQEGRAWPRLAVLLTVLAGLFLMHGMSAAPGSGCHSGMPMARTAEATPPTMAMAYPMPQHSDPHMTAVADTTSPVHVTVNAIPGDTCVPLRPDVFDGAGPIMLAVLWLVTGQSTGAFRAHSPRWPHGPPQSGIDRLHSLGVCRT